MAKITCVRIGTRKYNVAMLTPLTLAEFVLDVSKTTDLEKTLAKYNVSEA